MHPDIRYQDRSYRRGLVLGLTMAEIMVLILFTLLLALAAALAKKEQIIQQYHEFRERLSSVLERSNASVTVDDIFQEMRRQKEENDRLRAENTRLAAYEKAARTAESAFQELRRAGIQHPDSAQGIKEMTERLRVANAAIEAAKRAGAEPTPAQVAEMLTLASTVLAVLGGKDGAKPDAQQVNRLMADARDAQQRYRDILGQNRNLEEQLRMATAGRGGQLPPCWASAETGKAEYIFDVTITSTGLIVSNNVAKPELQHRLVQYETLPASMIRFDTELTQADFRRQTAALRKWGDDQEQKCRFFVRLFDDTRPDEKATFKRLMLTTGESFYYWLVPQ